MANRFYIKKKVDFSDLDWKRAVAITERRLASVKGAAVSGFALRVASRKIRDSFRGPLSLRWFRSLKLSTIESELMKSLCETQGADELTISSRYTIRILKASLVQDVYLAPFVRGDDEHKVKDFKAYLEIWDNRAPVALGAAAVFALNILMILIGIVLSAISLGLLFWGVAVFMVFVRSPLRMTTSAINRLDLWIALLCVLSGFSSIIGGLLRRIHGKIRRQPRE